MLDPTVLKELKTIVKSEHVLTSTEDRIAYSYDATFLEGYPDVVVTPTSTEEVSRVMQLAHARGVPVVPRGMGTGLAGGAIQSNHEILTFHRLAHLGQEGRMGCSTPRC